MNGKPYPRPSDWVPFTILDEDTCSAACVAYLDWTTNDRKGEQKLGPRAAYVTEGFNKASINQKTLKLNWPGGYSSCGALGVSELYTIGHRGKYINRTTEPGYRNGWNLIWLEEHPAFEHGPIAQKLPPGTHVYIGNKQVNSSLHGICVVEHRPEDNYLAIAQYGQNIGVGIDGVFTEYHAFDGKTVGAKKKPVIGHLQPWKALQWAEENGCRDSEVWVPPTVVVP